jgi:RNA polymerase sigma factor (sigma-70 family)
MNEDLPSEQTTPPHPDCSSPPDTPPDRQEWLRHVEQLHDQLLKNLTARLGRHDAQDVLQEFYLRVLRYRPRLEGDASMRSFINRILRSVVADHFRGRVAQRKVVSTIATLWEDPVTDDPVDAAVCDCLRGLMGELPRQYATLIERVDLNEEPRSAVAATLGITSKNLAVRLTRARSALRARLLAFCTSCPIHGFADCRCSKSPTLRTAR